MRRTYDFAHEILSVMDQAKVDVAPDEKGGGVIHVTSKAALMARQEHYVKFSINARLEGEGRLTEADEATIWLSADEKLIQRMELRGALTHHGDRHRATPQRSRWRQTTWT